MTGPNVQVIADRPTSGTPRPYDFPTVERFTLPNAVRVAVADLPGRPLVSASLVLRNGAADEPPAHAGATVLAARAMTEGTEKFDAIALIEATERLGASLHADAGWDATSVSVDVPATRLEAALELLAQVALHPTFPEAEVERLRDERLNDLLQARADPRRRADESYTATIYEAASPYHRPAGGTRETVAELTPGRLRAAYERGIDPARASFVIGGDLRGIDVRAIVTRLLGGWGPAVGAATSGRIVDASAVRERFVHVVHRPGAVQTEIRIGHVGVPRRIEDFHALQVMGAILGGLFNSRLNMKLREEKGYTYGAGAGFDLRRAAGPFSARAAVNTEVTVPAVADFVAELDRIRDAPVTPAELAAARDFLVGVFPLRFETPGPIVGALSGLFVHDLSDDELIHYRESIEGVDAHAVQDAAVRRINPSRMAIVLVGDADAFGKDIEAAGFGPVSVERDEGPAEEGRERPAAAAIQPLDAGEEGPTEGAEEPTGDTTDEEAGTTAPGEVADAT
jgi:zinc protease